MSRTPYSKYRAKPTYVDGIRFASMKEARRYMELAALQRSRIIKDLKLQERFALHVKGELICTYVADFVYTDHDGRPVVEDVKGVKTDVYKIKKALFEVIYAPLKITET